MVFNDSSEFRPTELVLVFSDFVGYTRAFAHHDDATLARLMNAFYNLSVEVVTRYHGRVVKFMGDACFAVFGGDAGADAVAAVLELRRRASPLTAAHGVALSLGARIHRGVVIEGQFGPPGHSRYDVIGAAVNTTARMGSGAHVFISDPVYQQLEPAARVSWEGVESGTTYRHIPEPTGTTGEA